MHRLSLPISVRRLSVLSCLLLVAVSLTSCSWLLPPPVQRGNKVDAEHLKELAPGTSTKADVTALIGSPTARATFDDNTWLYISEMTQQRPGRTLGEIAQNVVVVTFDDKGVMRDIGTKDMADSLPVSMVARTTPSPGTEASFMQQLLGNIGRFNPAGLVPGAGGGAGSAGGAPAPAGAGY
jgi:outer membrane protein assembly factor BamE (lipoprotein component of BamABCDE complex)